MNKHLQTVPDFLSVAPNQQKEFCETKLKNLENEPQHWIWAKQLGRSQLDDFTWSSVFVHLDDIRRAIFFFLFYSQPRWAFSKWYVPYVRNLINCFSIFSWICSRTWCLGDDQPENLQVGACHGSSQVNTSQGGRVAYNRRGKYIPIVQRYGNGEEVNVMAWCQVNTNQFHQHICFKWGGEPGQVNTSQVPQLPWVPLASG